MGSTVEWPNKQLADLPGWLIMCCQLEVVHNPRSTQEQRAMSETLRVQCHWIYGWYASPTWFTGMGPDIPFHCVPHVSLCTTSNIVRQRLTGTTGCGLPVLTS